MMKMSTMMTTPNIDHLIAWLFEMGAVISLALEMRNMQHRDG